MVLPLQMEVLMRYFIDTHPCCDGNHELHQNGCVVFPKRETVVLVGEFRSSYDALRAAHWLYPLVEGCRICCPECRVESSPISILL